MAPAPADLGDRRVEITGPTERKMAINALNSGAKVWLADLEDANTPHWDNVVSGQVNLLDAVRETIAFTSPEGKAYGLRPTIARWPTRRAPARLAPGRAAPRRSTGDRAVGALVDFGLLLLPQRARAAGPRQRPVLLPAQDGEPPGGAALERRLHLAEDPLGMPHGTIRATVLIETITAAFEMEEILYELREHAGGLNAGRWDYLFSIIKNFRDCGRDFVLPDRDEVTMTAPFMRAYTELLVSTCHRRGAFAIGGMAAFIPTAATPR